MEYFLRGPVFRMPCPDIRFSLGAFKYLNKRSFRKGFSGSGSGLQATKWNIRGVEENQNQADPVVSG